MHGVSRIGRMGSMNRFASIAAMLGRRLETVAVLGSEVSGDGVITGYRLGFAPMEGAADDQVVYIETAPEITQREGVLTIRDGETGEELGVWLYPRDPELPALPAAVYPDSARELLERMGVHCEVRSLTLLAYRPGKRAVVRVQSTIGALYLKVVTPNLTEGLVDRYAGWATAGLPVPQVLGWSADGLIAFTAMEGEPVASHLDRIDDPERFLDEVVELQRRVAMVDVNRAARPSLSSRLDWYLRRLIETIPEQRTQIERVALAVWRVLDEYPATVQVPVHGDLHIGQLFFDAQTGRLSGVLDIDTSGLGDPADDAAALYAHLVVTSLYHRDLPATAAKAALLAERWIARWPAVDVSFATRARAIAATHLLAHALGDGVPREPLLEQAGRIMAVESPTLSV